MKTFKFIVLIFFNVLLNINNNNNVYCKELLLNAKSYYLMPKIFDFDDFEQCKTLYIDRSKYCTFEIQLRPLSNLSTTHVWNIIEEANQDYRYRHDILYKGRCVPNDLSNGELIKNQTTAFQNEFSKDNLNVTISAHFCNIFNKNEDIYDQIGRIFIIVWILFIITCSVIVRIYEKLPKIIGKITDLNLLKQFSLSNNWRQLFVRNEKEEYKYVHGIRYFAMINIIIIHCVIKGVYLPWKNTQTIEENYKQTHFLEITTVSVQVFFLLSGMFMSLSLYKIMDKESFNVKTLTKMTFKRYMRLTPALFIVILFNTTILYYQNLGPNWEKSIGTSRRNCRKYLWTSLLFINNYVKSFNQMCLTHTWYLSADFQLYIIALVLLSIIWIRRNIIWPLLGISLAISIIIPGIVTYIYVLDPYPIINLDRLVNLVTFEYKTISAAYIPTHTNATAYIVGLIFGYLLYTKKLQNIKWNATKTYWFQKLWLASFIILLSSVYLFAAYAHSTYYTYNRILAALYASSYKFIFISGIIVLIWGFEQNIGQSIKRYLQKKGFIIMSRLSYCIYLTHWSVIEYLFSSESSDLVFKTSIQLRSHIFIVIVSVLIALLLHLFVEAPIRGAVNYLMDDKARSKDNEITKLQTKRND